MAQVWTELAELYGQKAKIKYGKVGGDVFNSWCRKLQGLNPDEIIRGLSACILRKQEWPPELQEFMRLCVDTKKATCHQEYKKLPVLKAEKGSCEVARHEALVAAGVIRG